MGGLGSSDVPCVLDGGRPKKARVDEDCVGSALASRSRKRKIASMEQLKTKIILCGQSCGQSAPFEHVLRTT